MDYREYALHPALRPFVRTYWSLCGAAEQTAPQPVLPDGATELIIHREHPFIRHVADGRAERQAPTLFAGQLCAPAVLCSDGAAEVVGVRFRPAGAFALLRAPQHEWLDAIVDVDAIDAPWLRRAARASQGASSLAEAIAHIESALLYRVRASDLRSDARIDAALSVIDGASGDCRIDDLSRSVGSGRRQLERLFRDHVGLTPKAYARIVRFQAAAARVAHESATPLVDVSLDAGYCDQSHMIHDFLAFAGRTPLDFRTRLGELTRVMLSD